MELAKADNLQSGELVRTVGMAKRLIPQSDLNGNLVILRKKRQKKGLLFLLSDGNWYPHKKLRNPDLSGGIRKNRPFPELFAILKENDGLPCEMAKLLRPSEWAALFRLFCLEAADAAGRGTLYLENGWLMEHGITGKKWMGSGKKPAFTTACISAGFSCGNCPFAWSEPPKDVPTPCALPGAWAADLARAFIHRDKNAYRELCKKGAFLPTRR